MPGVKGTMGMGLRPEKGLASRLARACGQTRTEEGGLKKLWPEASGLAVRSQRPEAGQALWPGAQAVRDQNQSRAS